MIICNRKGNTSKEGRPWKMQKGTLGNVRQHKKRREGTKRLER